MSTTTGNPINTSSSVGSVEQATRVLWLLRVSIVIWPVHFLHGARNPGAYSVSSLLQQKWNEIRTLCDGWKGSVWGV